MPACVDDEIFKSQNSQRNFFTTKVDLNRHNNTAVLTDLQKLEKLGNFVGLNSCT